MKKIVVPTDFSQQATYALDLAYEIAKKENAEITLVHVVDIPDSRASFLGGAGSIRTEATLGDREGMERVFVMKLIEKRERQFAEVISNPKYAGVTIKEKFKKGNPYRQIAETITDVDADLIIMGTTGADNWEEDLIGSTAEKVVRHATCPVFTLRKGIHINDVKNIALASDLKDDFGKFKDVPKMLMNFFDAKIHLVYVNTPSHFTNDREVRKEMNDLIEKNGLEGVERHIYHHKNPGEGIIFFAEDNNMDLIMMSTSGERSGIFKLFDHSIAEEVVNHSKKPVVTFNLHNA